MITPNFSYQICNSSVTKSMAITQKGADSAPQKTDHIQVRRDIFLLLSECSCIYNTPYYSPQMQSFEEETRCAVWTYWLQSLGSGDQDKPSSIAQHHKMTYKMIWVDQILQQWSKVQLEAVGTPNKLFGLLSISAESDRSHDKMWTRWLNWIRKTQFLPTKFTAVVNHNRPVSAKTYQLSLATWYWIPNSFQQQTRSRSSTSF